MARSSVAPSRLLVRRRLNVLPLCAGATKAVDPDLVTSPRLKDNVFLAKDPDSKVAKKEASAKKKTSRYCMCLPGMEPGAK